MLVQMLYWLVCHRFGVNILCQTNGQDKRDIGNNDHSEVEHYMFIEVQLIIN